ncbi:MAG: hypothetical protein J6L83_05465 [Clostridia bacterium]|nr:hypothetical protein [Clostridia bacterium]
MTGGQLREQMLARGGRNKLVNIEGVVWLESANRAIFEVNRLFPVVNKIQLVNYPLTPVVYHGGIRVHKGGEDIRIDASGVKSLAFAVSGGGGRAVLCDSTGDIIHTFGVLQNNERVLSESTKFVTYSYVISKDARDVTLVFSGDFNYLIKDVSFYGDVKSEDKEDVDVFSPWVKYDLKGIDYLGERFMAFDSTPVRFDNVSLNSPYDYKIEGSAVYLRADRPGIYEISVMVMPRSIDELNDSVDVDPQAEDLLALLAASYLYSVTDTEIADRCMQEYQRILPIALANARRIKTPSQYRNTLKGW